MSLRTWIRRVIGDPFIAPRPPHSRPVLPEPEPLLPQERQRVLSRVEDLQREQEILRLRMEAQGLRINGR